MLAAVGCAGGAAQTPPPGASAVCPPAPAVSPESLIAAGRFWHAERAAPPLPPPPRPLQPEVAELHLEIAEGLGAWSQVDGIVARVRGADTIPAIVLLAARRDEQAERWHAAEARYRRLAALPAASPSERATAAVALAVALERMDLPDSAAAAWRRAAQLLPPIEDWLAVRRAELEPDTALAFATVATMHSPGAAAAAADLVADRRLAAGNPAGALKIYLRRGRPLDAARAELALGRRDVARRRVDLALAADPSQPVALLAANFLVAEFATRDPVELLGIARAYRARGDLRSAESYARRAAANDTGVAAWATVASIAAARHRLAEARAALDSASRRLRQRPGAPTSVLAPASVQVLAAAGRWADAEALVARLARENPGDSSVATAALYLADRARLRGADDEERALNLLLARGFGGTGAGAVARFRLGLAWYAAGRRDSAASALAALRTEDRGGWVGRAARYWMARIALEHGEPSGAAELHAIAAAEPTGYLGVRARELLGEPLELAADSAPPAAGSRLDPGSVAGRIRLLVTVGLAAEARAEALGWVADTGASQAALAAAGAAAAAAGFGREAVLLGDAARSHGPLTRAVAEAFYPLPWWGVIEGESAEACIDPLLMAAIIRQESRFQSFARSRAGARGLSQMEPRTARDISRRLGLRPWPGPLLDVPDFNLHLGTRYVRERMARGPLPLHVLIAAFNAGAGRLTQWQGWPEFRDPDLFVERLSVSETRDYVRNVYANYAWYRRLYGTPAADRR